MFFDKQFDLLHKYFDSIARSFTNFKFRIERGDDTVRVIESTLIPKCTILKVYITFQECQEESYLRYFDILHYYAI